MTELQQCVGSAVNAIVKHFYATNGIGGNARNRGSELTQLLCGERGLVQCLEQVFLFGRQDALWSAATRFFRQHYPWDYLGTRRAWNAMCDLQNA